MKKLKSADAADVFQDEAKVGTLRRTRNGSSFEYDAGFWETHSRSIGGIAIHLPYAQRRFETRGVNLPPFFAGLLPEGLRLSALVRRVKTSEDDLLSLLLATGADCIGDISVVREGETPTDAAPHEAPPSLEQSSFSELFEQSLARAGEATAEPSLPGVQQKVSASVISFPVSIAKTRAAYILKLNPPNMPKLVENEAFFMAMAKDCDFEVAQNRIVRDRDGAVGLLVQRFDRKWSKEKKRLQRIHQEDACQFLDQYPGDKYRITCREIAEGLKASAAPIPETARLIRLIAFSYLIANGDLHAKNVSISATGATGELRLTPAYDLLSTLPYGDRKMALKIEGRDDNIRGKTFVAFGERLGVKQAATSAYLESLYETSKPWIARLEEIGLEAKKTADLRRVLTKRRAQLIEF